MTVVNKTINHCRSHLFIVEDMDPFAELKIRCDYHAPLLILNFDSEKSENSKTWGKMERKTDVPPQWSIM